MTDDGDQGDELDVSVKIRRERLEQWRREGERPIGRNLAMIGALGWLIVVPTLIGMFAGRWLDHRFDTQIFWTTSLLFVGLVIGCYLAWRRAHRE